MSPIIGSPEGSFYFDNQPNMLDQFLVNKNMVTGDASVKVDPATVQILKPWWPQVSTRSRSRSVNG